MVLAWKYQTPPPKHRFALLLFEHLLSISVVCACGPLIPQSLQSVGVCAHTHKLEHESDRKDCGAP